MTSARLFAAVNANGDLRFVGDVPGGSACGCFCSVCGSPLVARQGAINVWHFAHEAQQERVECLVGAMNLLRRVAAEHLRSLPKLVLPTYRREITRAVGARRVTETAQWDAQPVSIEWLEPHSQDAPIARMILDTEQAANLYVEVSEGPGTLYPSDATIGSLVFWSSVPVNSDLRKELYARQHAARAGRMLWLHQPDAYGLVADAHARLARAAAEEERIVAEQVKRNRAYLERSHAERHNVPAPVIPPLVVSEPEWVKHKKPHASYFGYRFRGIGAWVLFELADGRCGIRNLDGVDRWHEALSHAGVTYEPALDLLIAPTFAHGQRQFQASPEATRISTNLTDVLQLRAGQH
jgi:hypothetical protein